jgi:Tfp pilus assembly pilus retraction ATPase PilT
MKSPPPDPIIHTRDALERIIAFILHSAEQPGVTDVSLRQNGRAVVRANTFLKAIPQPWLTNDWIGITALLGNPPWLEKPPRLRALRATVDLGGHRFRCTWGQTRSGETVDVRPIPRNIKTPEELKLPGILPETLAALSGGLVLFVGATGAGKSWTMASLIRHRARIRGGKYVLIENPVEFLHEDTDKAEFYQMEVGKDVESYSAALEDVMAQNPDVLVVQELIDRRSAENTLSAALSGHLVMATMHSQEAASVPSRFAGLLEPEDEGAYKAALYRLSVCLEMVVVMRLMPGHNGLVPVFEVLTMRERPGGQRINKLVTLVAKGDAVGLRNEILMGGSRAGMMTMENSVQGRIDEGLLSL